MDVEVNNHTEITPPNTTVSNGNNNASKDGVPTGGYVIPYTGELVEAHRVPTSSGQRIKLQAEVNTDYKFLTICDPASPRHLADLKAQLEIEYNELYPNELPIVIVRLQDSRKNGDLLKDKDKVYIVIKPMSNPEDEGVDSGNTPAPRQRGRKRKNQDHKDIKGLDTPNKKPTLSSLSPQNQLSPSQSPTTTQLQLQQQQLQPLSQITPYSPSAKVSSLANNNVQERVVCNPYCALIETRDNVPCQHCGELRPYVVPDSEKTDRNQCSKWCVTGSTRKLKAAGLEFCSICLARHRAGKYDLRKAHQCLSCHRPWLHLDEYMYCRTCRKSAMGTDKEAQMAPPPMTLSNSLSLLSGNGTPMHLSSQPQHHPPPQLPPLPSHLSQPSSLLSHRILSPPPPHHISLHDLHKRPDLEKKAEQKAQSIPLQQLHHFQQQSQQLLGVNSPQHHSPPPSSAPGGSLPLGVGVGGDKVEGKDNSNIIHHHHHHHHDNGEEDHAHAHTHTHDAQTHAHADHETHGHAHGDHETHAHAHTHTHSHADPHSAEQLAEMVLSQIPAGGQEGEQPLTNSYYDPTLPITTQEKVGS